MEDREQLVVDPLESMSLAEPDKSTYVSSLLSGMGFLDQCQIIQAEVDNLLALGFIREIKYPEWLANVVVVPKEGEK